MTTVTIPEWQKNHAKFHLSLLGSREKYHLVAKNHQIDKVENVWLKQNEVLPWVERKTREGYTCWISLNDKEFANDSINGVRALQDIWFDIDSKRRDKTFVNNRGSPQKRPQKREKIP